MYYLLITVAVLTTPSTAAVREVECGYLYILSSSRSSVTILISGRTHYVSIGINCRASALRCDKSVGCEAGAGCGCGGQEWGGGGASIQRDVSEWCAASGVSAREHCRRRQVQPARSLPAPRCHCACHIASSYISRYNMSYNNAMRAWRLVTLYEHGVWLDVASHKLL